MGMDEDLNGRLDELREMLSGVESSISALESEVMHRLSVLTEERSAISGLITAILARLERLEERR